MPSLQRVRTLLAERYSQYFIRLQLRDRDVLDLHDFPLLHDNGFHGVLGVR